MIVENIPVLELAQECIAAKSALAEERGVSLGLDLGDANARIQGDRALLKAAVGNLIDGAVRDNRPGGRVTLAHRREAERDSIAVVDSGGIPFDKLRAMQELICRVHPPEADETPGMDGRLVALFIVRDIADLHGGRVGLRSAEGEGSALTLHLPRSQRGSA